MKPTAAILCLLMLCVSAHATVWYVDSTASGTHNGTSWSTAWLNVTSVSGVSAGDTVYISGGASGSTNTYSIPNSAWTPKGGTSGSPITYQIGQDSSHNGVALFTGNGSSGQFFVPVNYVTVSGDAGDGQMHFAVQSIPVAPYWDSSTVLHSLHIAFVNFGVATVAVGSQASFDWAYLAVVQDFQFHNCYIKETNVLANSIFYVVAAGAGYDDSLIYSNTFLFPDTGLGSGDGGTGSGDGADCIESGGSEGLSCYNNTCTGFKGYSGSQHQDFFQDTGGSSYVKIHDNTIVNSVNSGIFFDAYFGTFSNCKIYNNLIYLTFTPVGSPRGIDIISDSNPNYTGNYAFVNVICMNNMAAGFTTLYGIGFYPDSHYATTTYSACQAFNNVSFNNQSGYDLANQTGFSQGNNSTLGSGGSTNFVNSAASNFNLVSNATTLIGQGANESTYFVNDLNGTTRPASAAWDLGTYQFSSTNAPMIHVAPSSYNFGTVLTNLSVTNTFNVTNTATGTLTGTASVSSPFSILSGSSYSLTNGQGQAVQVVFSPTTAGNYTNNVTFTGGGGFSAQVIGVATNLPPSTINNVPTTPQLILFQ
jgi:hypothetical protein